ncbi:MAG: peptidoglycan-binding protein [Clostridia bacterium]|nr:peptidoglycan-binding protein [Clostridia bacterium]
MDLMRTLLIYLSATLTLAVQNTAAPVETPVPTPEPQAVVETVATPGPGEEPMITPKTTSAPAAQPAAATEKITPFPVPAITPNERAYHNIGMGAKGKEVKRIQEKLIELNYLPAESADGAYGRQTANAVRKFQYYNGLTADGIAGRRTQTYLFENPDIVANPEAAATEVPTPEVTEAPTEVPTEVPTEAPTETPTEVPTEEPTAEPTEEPTAEPTEEPAEEPTEAPTEAPAEEPEATEAPEAAEEPAPTDDPEEIIENVDLDAEVYELIVASVALNEGDGPLEFVAMKDGVPVKAQPRLSQNGAKIRISLDDLCKCVESWQLTDDGAGTVVLEAAGYILALYNEGAGCSASVDGNGIPMKEEDFDFLSEGHFINAEFLAEALKGECVWEQEENTLILRILDKEDTED